MTAFAHWTAMHAWWCARRTEREAIGRAWPPKAAAASPPPADPCPAGRTDRHQCDCIEPELRRKLLLDRYKALGPEAQTAYKALGIDKNDLDAVQAALNQIESDEFQGTLDVPGEPVPLEIGSGGTTAVAAAPPTRKRAPVRKAKQKKDPGEGITDLVAEADKVRARYTLLGPEGKAWIKRLVEEGDVGAPWRLSDATTVRNVDLYRGVIVLAGWPTTDDDIIRSIAANITGTYSPDTPAGAVLGGLTDEQANLFAAIAADITIDHYDIVPDQSSGGYRITPATQ